jgi:hypothetical protein
MSCGGSRTSAKLSETWVVVILHKKLPQFTTIAGRSIEAEVKRWEFQGIFLSICRKCQVLSWAKKLGLLQLGPYSSLL